MAAVFSEWSRLPLSLSELCINTTLRCGQSFRWHNVPDTDEWRCVLHGRLLSLKQDKNNLYYRIHRASETTLPTPPDTPTNNDNDPDTLSLLTHYFNLAPNLTTLYAQWSSADANFRKKAPGFTGIRILRQNAWEALVSFICSSNNNIARIAQMVDKLCRHYGPFIATLDGRDYHDFPPPEALTADDVESRLRSLGFGYRAKYIYQTAVIVSTERGEGWLDGLRNPEAPLLGTFTGSAGEMKPEGRDGYRDAHEKLLELQGVGPKVADCVCLMGLGWGEAVPVDTHVWQIAQRDYKFGKGSHKSLTKPTYDAVGNLFRKLWGKEAGWAHSVLFTADLRAFSDRLAPPVDMKKEVTVKVKSEDMDDIKTDTVPTGIKRSASEETKPDIQPQAQAHSTRTSKRLRNR